MAKFTRTINLPGHTAEALYEKIAKDLERFLEKGSPVKAQITSDATAKTMFAKSSMFSASLQCTDGAIHVDVTLGLLAMPFRSKLDEGIDKWLKRTFPPTA